MLGGLAYVAYNIAKGRTGGTAFFNDQDTNSEVGSLGAGATVVKIQVCMDENWTDGNNIMSSLAKLANRNNNNMASSAQSDRATLSRMLSEVSMILLRKQSQWVSASIRGERFGGNILNAANDAKRAEPYFQKLAIQERSKFDKETIESRGYNPNEIVYDRNGNVMNGKSTPAVVSIIVAVRGKSDSLRSLTSTRDLADALQTLAAEASSDDGENVLAVEVLWTPSEPGEKMDMRSIIVDYPDLIEL